MSIPAATEFDGETLNSRPIGDVAIELGLDTQVLRYWEGKFNNIVAPLKSDDGRRMFRPQDVEGARAIQILVHDRGMTLKAAAAYLAEHGVSGVTNRGMPDDIKQPCDISGNYRSEKPAVPVFSPAQPAVIAQENQESTERLESILSDLVRLKARLDALRLD